MSADTCLLSSTSRTSTASNSNPGAGCGNPCAAVDAANRDRALTDVETILERLEEIGTGRRIALAINKIDRVKAAIAAGVDTTIAGRNSVASVSVRYERNIGYGDAVDTDAISGIARGSLAIVPRAVTFEAGALASRTRIDGDRWDTPEVPLGEEAEVYRVQVRAGSTVLRDLRVTTPDWAYSAADQASDGASAGDVVQVAQVSARYGAGPVAEWVLA